MIKTGACLVCVWTGAWILRGNSVYLDYYYAIMVFVGFVYGLRTGSHSYGGLMAMMAMIYLLENSSQIWHESIYVLAAAYLFFAITMLIFPTDDDLKLSPIIASLMALKCVSAVALKEHGYLMHTLLNFLSIAQWVIFARIAAARIKLNQGYGAKEDNPFMLRVKWVLTWSLVNVKNTLKTHSGGTPVK